MLALRGVHLIAGDGDRAGCHRLAAVVEQGMAGPAAMPDLKHDAAPGAVHGLGGEAPAIDLGLVVDAGLMPEGGIAFHHHGGLGHDQPRTGALAVVLGHQGAGYMALLCAAAGEGCHPDAVGQLQ